MFSYTLAPKSDSPFRIPLIPITGAPLEWFLVLSFRTFVHKGLPFMALWHAPMDGTYQWVLDQSVAHIFASEGISRYL